MGAMDGRVLVVTGGGRGIGRAVALLAAAEGASVVVNDTGCEPDGTGSNPAIADATVAAIVAAGGKAVANYGDVSTLEGGEGAIKAALEQYGRIDALANCAGIRRDTPIWAMTEEDWDTVIRGNVKSQFIPSKFAGIAMRQQRYGRVVSMVNDAGLGAVGAANYAAAGEGAIGFTRTLARDLGRYGITANAISPLARTRLAGGLSEDLRPPAGVIDALTVARIGRPNPLTPWEDTGHPDDPESVAPLAVYLLSEACDNINAQVFGVRGGDIYLYSNPAIDRQIVSYGRRFTMEEMDDLMPRTLGLNIPRPVIA